MKVVKLDIGIPDFKAIDIIKVAVVTDASGRGINIAEQRRRLRILDAVEKAGESNELRLEDADYELLKSLYATCPFAHAHVGIVRTADAIDAAEPVSGQV